MKGYGYGAKGAKKMKGMSKGGKSSSSGKKKAKVPMRSWNRS